LSSFTKELFNRQWKGCWARTWQPQMNTSRKTVSAVFHLNNKEAKCELKFNHNNKTLPFYSEPKYFWVMLDRSLTYRRHPQSLRKTLTSRVAFLRRLAGSGWVAGATALRIIHSCPGPFNSRVLRSYTVPQRSYPPHWPLPSVKPCELRLDACVLTNRQLPYSRRHRTCWSSSQRSHTLSSTSFHGAWTPALLSAHLSTGCECTASQIETPICTRRTTTHQLTWQQQKCDALGGSPMEGGMIE